MLIVSGMHSYRVYAACRKHSVRGLAQTAETLATRSKALGRA